jgi:hypothetical protein
MRAGVIIAAAVFRLQWMASTSSFAPPLNFLQDETGRVGRSRARVVWRSLAKE